MKKMFLKIKGLWNGWIDFAPKFLLAVLAFVLLTLFVQLSQSVSQAAVFPEGGSVTVGCGNGNPGQLTKAALVYHTFSSKEAIDEYFNSPTDEKVKRLIGMAPGPDGTGGGCDINGNSCKMADNGGCTADKNGYCEATAGIPQCSVAQLDCLGGTDGGSIKFNREGCSVPPKKHLICENNACKSVDGDKPNEGGCKREGDSCGEQKNPRVTCEALSLDVNEAGKLKATITKGEFDGGKVQSYKFQLGNNPVVNSADHILKFNVSGEPGTYTVRGWVVDQNGAAVTSNNCLKTTTVDNRPNNYCGTNNTCVQCVPGTPGYDACKDKPSCSSDLQCQPNVNYYCGTNYTCDACVPGSANYNQCKNKPSCSTDTQCQVQPNNYCGTNNTCVQCIPGTAGYDACKNKPSCSTDAQCQVQPNYYCDASETCSQCVPGSANYNECKNKPSCTSSDQCKTTQKFTCQDYACKVCTGGDCLNQPSCSTQDECKQSYYSCTENNTCQKFYGSGTSTCNPGSTDCQVHNECDGYSCKQVRGAYRGGALCSNDDQCKPVVNQNTYCDWLFVDPQTGNAALTVNAQISGHTVNGGSIAQYRFNFGDGSGDKVQSGDKLSHTFTENGTYVVSGHVIDNRGVQAGGSGACQKVVQVVVPGVTPPPPSGKGGVPSTGAETLLLPLFSLLGTFGWAMRRIRGN